MASNIQLLSLIKHDGHQKEKMKETPIILDSSQEISPDDLKGSDSGLSEYNGNINMKRSSSLPHNDCVTHDEVSTLDENSKESHNSVEGLSNPYNNSRHESNNQEAKPGHSGNNDVSGKDSGDPKMESKLADIVPYSSEPSDPHQGPPSAKDSGYAWVVVLMVFLVNVVTAGYVKSFGITYTLILDYFPDTSGAASGWIMGLLVGCRGLLAPAMGALTVKIGPRRCVVIGTLMCVAGLLLAVPAFSIAYLAFTLGGVVGTGMCMAETPGFLIVTDYFEKKRALANGFRAAGNPMGGVLFAPLIVILQQHFGLRGAFIIVAGLMLQLVVVGMFMRPFEQHQKLIEDKYWIKIQRDEQASDLQTTALKEYQTRQPTKRKKPLDFTFLKNPAYLVYLLMVMCTSAALPGALLYTPAYGRSIGLTDLQNSAIASYTSVCDVFMRLSCGFIFNRKNTNKRYGFIAGLMVGGVGCLFVPLCTRLWHLLIFATMFSLCMAFCWTLVNTLLADQFGGENMASTWGFFRMLQGLCNFFYPPLVGFVMDLSGGLAVPFMMMGFMLILGATIFALQPIIAKLPGSKVNL